MTPKRIKQTWARMDVQAPSKNRAFDSSKDRVSWIQLKWGKVLTQIGFTPAMKQMSSPFTQLLLLELLIPKRLNRRLCFRLKTRRSLITV